MIIWTAKSSDIQPGEYPDPITEESKLIEFKTEDQIDAWMEQVRAEGEMVTIIGTFTPYGPEFYPGVPLGAMN